MQSDKLKPNEIDQYFRQLSPEALPIMENIRQLVKSKYPEAKEQISYQMPSFKLHGVLVWYAAFANHYSVFFGPTVLAPFLEEIKRYDTTKSAIRFKYNEQLPSDLFLRILCYSYKLNSVKASKRKK